MALSRPTYSAMRDRAERIQRMIATRAQRRFDVAFGGTTDPRGGFPCFHLAHNWVNLPSLSADQRAACRYVRHMERRQWEPFRILDRWYARRGPACLRAED